MSQMMPFTAPFAEIEGVAPCVVNTVDPFDVGVVEICAVLAFQL